MKKFFASVVSGLLFLTAASVFAQEGSADIEQFIREQRARLATVSLELLHFDITHAADRALRAFAAYSRTKEKISILSDDHETACVLLPAIPHGKVLREVRASVEQVVNLMGRAAPLLKAGGTPSEGMKKLIGGDMPQLMQTIAADGAKLQALISDLETSCGKEG